MDYAIFRLRPTLSNKVRARGGGQEGREDVEGG